MIVMQFGLVFSYKRSITHYQLKYIHQHFTLFGERYSQDEPIQTRMCYKPMVTVLQNEYR